MTIEELVKNTDKLDYQALCSALIKKFGVTRPVTWESVLPHPQQQGLFGGEVLRLIADHPTLATQKEIRPVCLFPGDISQLLFFYVQLKDEKLPKSAIERITRKFIGGAAAERYIIWFFGNSDATKLKVVISGKEGKKIRLKTLELEAGQWFKTYDLILNEVERKFNTGGLFQSLKEPSGLWKAVWEAFDISIVNKKFYAEIKEVFDLLVKEELPKSKGILLHDDERVQFAIRLIGRVIFCWFLKRKGIIADDVLSAKAVKNNSNYYHDLLERLFFDVFNTPKDERKGDLPSSISNYPFLNGGLFEPQHEDHKGSWALNIGNDWFIRFFGNTLERYNFTVDENSAASSEIAIDPEMLGRIFENLLAEQNPDTGESTRKSTGSFYTPREIVDFMVEESLIAYLTSKLSPSPQSPPVKGGETIGISPPSEGRGGFRVPSPLAGEGPGGGVIEDFVRTGILPDPLKPYTKDLLRLLDAIKVLDPASGSGAFPISMLQKIVGLKHQLDAKATLYELKLRTIENSIYGVDIQPMATELSRLRCWLSLIVDEEPKDIKPLPNLDFKFITANSLIDLGYDEFIHKVQGGTDRLFLTGFINKMNELRDVRKKYFEATASRGEKDRLKKEFNVIQSNLLKMSLEPIRLKQLDAEFTNKITGWNPFDDSRPAPFFNKSWMFGVEDGFDIVIGNPPYVQIQSFSGQPVQKQWEAQKYATYTKTGDIYCLFYERGFNLLSPHGVLTYITSNKWMRAAYGAKLREFFANHSPQTLIDFGGYQVFESATVDTNILILRKVLPDCKKTPLRAIRIEKDFAANTDIADYVHQKNVPMNNLSAESWIISSGPDYAIRKKIEEIGVPLKKWDVAIYRGILTGLNEAFIINGAKRDELIAQDPKSAEIIKPILRGRDIKRYQAEFANLWLINSHNGYGKVPRINVQKDYPAIWEHLQRINSETNGGVEKRQDQGQHWSNLRNCAYLDGFEKEKIVYPDIMRLPKGNNDFSNYPYFYLDKKKYYIEATNFVMTGDGIYLITAILSSRFGVYAFTHFYTGPQFDEKGFRYKKEYLQHFPIPKLDPTAQRPFEILVDQILAAKQKDPKADTSALERQIDEMVYKLYGLTPEEIAVVEGKK